MGYFADKRVFTTCGASGIGRTTTLEFVKQGAQVAVCDIKFNEEISSLVSSSGQGVFLQGDIALETDVARMVADSLERLGGIDILVNCAGIILEKPLLETTLEQFERIMAVNLRGTFLTGREVLRDMNNRQSGRVINVASELAHLGRKEFSVYCASKGAVVSLTRSWAREFAPNILVNAVAPGPVNTGMLDIENRSKEWVVNESDIPLQRIAEPSEIAQTIVFLAGPGATFITGQIVGANGGAAMY